MASNLKIREATPSDTPSIVELLKKALGETSLLKRTAQLYDWKHKLNPFGPSIVLVAETGHQMVGVRAFMRWELEDPSGSVVRCVRAVDTATHPNFARQGIFSQLTRSALEVARDDGVQMVFNTPNAKSGAGYLKMGWSEVGWIDVYARPRIGRAVQPGGKVPDIREVIPAAAPQIPSGSDREPFGLRTPRTAEYLLWRFNSHPTARYGWVGDDKSGAIVRASERGGRSESVISDLLFGADPKAVRAVRKSSRARYVATWFAPGTPELEVAKSGGLRKVPTVKALRLVAFPLEEIGHDVTQLSNWDFATSDLELL